MSLSHHGPDREPSELVAAIKRFNEQLDGTAKRAYEQGRMGAEDDGVLSYAISTNDRHRTIVIRFGKPVEWIGLGVKEATELRDNLTARIMALRGIE